MVLAADPKSMWVRGPRGLYSMTTWRSQLFCARSRMPCGRDPELRVVDLDGAVEAVSRGRDLHGAGVKGADNICGLVHEGRGRRSLDGVGVGKGSPRFVAGRAT